MTIQQIKKQLENGTTLYSATYKMVFNKKKGGLAKWHWKQRRGVCSANVSKDELNRMEANQCVSIAHHQ